MEGWRGGGGKESEVVTVTFFWTATGHRHTAAREEAKGPALERCRRAPPSHPLGTLRGRGSGLLSDPLIAVIHAHLLLKIFSNYV